jgi:hypothetical protein
VHRETASVYTENGRDRSASAGSVGTATASKRANESAVITGPDAEMPRCRDREKEQFRGLWEGECGDFCGARNRPNL